MKKVVALILCAAMLMSLCACGDSGKKLTKAEIVSALQDCDGTLETKGKDDNIKRFSYTIENVSAEYLANGDFLYNSIEKVMNDMSRANTYQINAFKVFPAIVMICATLAGEDAQTSWKELWEVTENIICKNQTIEYCGWKVSAKISKNDDSIVFKVKK